MKKLVSIAVLSLLSFAVFQALDIPQNTLNIEDAVASHGGTCGGYAQDGPYGCFCTSDTMVCNDGSTSDRHLPYCYFSCGGGGGSGTPSAPTISASNSCSGSQPRNTLSWSWHFIYNYDVFRCTGSSCMPTTKVATVSGWEIPWTDTSVTSGTTYQYRIQGWYYPYFMLDYKVTTSYSNIVTVTAPTCSAPTPPTADLKVVRCDEGEDVATCMEVAAESVDGASDANIADLGLAEEIGFIWNSENTAACSGTNFSTGFGYPVDGYQSSVTEPSAGNTTIYTLSCNDGSQAITDAISVTRVDEASDDPIVTSDQNPVDSGESIVLSWNTASCTAEETTLTADKEGTGLPSSYGTALPSTTGDVTLEITETTIFTISCANRSTSLTVRAIPQFFET